MPEIPEGWFYPNDIVFYREVFESLPDGAKVLEIGCWKGRSICSVADIIQKKNITVHVVDTFLGSEDEKETFHKEAQTVDIEKIFRDNIESFGITKNIVVLKGDSRQIWNTNEIPNGYFDFIFIDGQHTTEAVEADMKHSLPKLKKDGIMAGHDAVLWFVLDGVRRVVGDCFSVRDNIWIKNKIVKENTNKIIMISAWSKPMRNGSWSAKNPSKEYWTKLIKQLKDKGYDIWQCGQATETKLKFVDRYLWDKDLWSLGEDIKRCNTWISCDNFFHHWALLQFKKPGVVIWSQSDPEIFGHPGNVNLLKDKKYLREKQFEVWENATYDRESFVDQEIVIKAVEEIDNKNV